MNTAATNQASNGSRASGRLQYFESMYGESEDPYALRTRWYEARKRAVLLAALPRARYRNAYEPGCGVGELTAALAPRCDTLLASDFSDKALAAARKRTSGFTNVRVHKEALPRDWAQAQGPFDLIVLSEVGYFLDAGAMRAVAQCCSESLTDDGTLVACDWLPDFDERALQTSEVQADLDSLGLTRIVRHEEADFLLQVWSRDARSVAQQENIR